MELKYLIIALVIFGLIGSGLVFLGSRLVGAAEGVVATAEQPPVMGQVLDSVADFRDNINEAQKRQEELMNTGN